MHLLIVEDHSLVREGLRMMLEDTRRFERCWELGTLAEALDRAAELGSDLGLVVLDLGLPDASGIEVLDRMLAASGDAPVLVVTGEDDLSFIAAAFARGARGYVPKNSSGPALRAAVETVLAGELYVPPHVLPSRKVGSPSSPPPPFASKSPSTPPPPSSGAPASTPPPRPATPQVPLTARQIDVLRLVAKGLQNKEIADELGMSPSTVRVHVTAVLKALGVENRTQAALSEVARSLICD